MEIEKRAKPLVMTVAGSDNTGGAGVQADLRAFEANGVHGFSVITAITAQKVDRVLKWIPVELDLIRLQMESLLESYPVKYVKCGMLPTADIIKTVAEFKKKYGFHLVVDPVLIGGSGDPLTEEGIIDAYKEFLFPVMDEDDVLTPNVYEAEKFTGVKISDVNTILQMGAKFEELGVSNILLKGGHIMEDSTEVIDYLYALGGIEMFSRERVFNASSTHGTGCVFSSVLTAQLSIHDGDLISALENTEEQMENYFQRLLYFPIKSEKTDETDKISDWNGARQLYYDGPTASVAILDTSITPPERKIIEEVYKIYKFFSSKKLFAGLVPEVRTNISVGLRGAKRKEHIAAIEGRITVVDGFPYASGPIKIGVSNHTARLLITAASKDPEIRCVMNLKYMPEYINPLAEEGFYLFKIDRELQANKDENNTMQWIINESYKAVKRIPDIIWDEGEMGKEPMLRLFARDASDMIEKLKAIHRAIKKLKEKEV